MESNDATAIACSLFTQVVQEVVGRISLQSKVAAGHQQLVIVITTSSPTILLSLPFFCRPRGSRHIRQKRPSSLTRFTITIENSNMSKYSTAVAKKEREGKENNACL